MSVWLAVASSDLSGEARMSHRHTGDRVSLLRGPLQKWRAPSDRLQSPIVLIIFSTVFGLIGASLGWWKDTRVLYRRPGSKWTTDLVPKEKIRSSILSRRRRKRLMTTV